MKDMTKKLLFLMIGIVVLIIILVLISSCTSKNKTYDYSYSQVEDVIISAAKSYAKNNNGFLPTQEGFSIDLDVNTLISQGYMEELSKYLKNSVGCSAKVSVTKTGEYYYYSPYLSCGDNYQTKLLSDKLLENIVTEEDGLYEMNQYYDGKLQKSYVFKGEEPNNYVKFKKNGQNWRIVKINPDRTITVIMDYLNANIFSLSSWDNRYNINVDSNLGIDDFETSRLKERLESYYKNNFSVKFKEKIVAKKLCVGQRSILDSKNDGSIECSKYSEDEMYLGLLPMYDFMNVSLDKNCKMPEDRSCVNYNYINKYSNSWWLLTTNSKATHRGYIVSTNIRRTDLSDDSYDRIVAVLNSNIVFSSGDGTLNNPYILK